GDRCGLGGWHIGGAGRGGRRRQWHGRRARRGVLGAALVGGGLAVASRVRGERWPGIGIAGAVISALPLLMYLLRMMLKL
ncbi:hypothetical protein, partial [Pseudomonas aeruginosa]|uniref:hypothetical protein n=1 Tax=Pseudomonas aeruginosa TaxID=287 RepID=UPI003007F6F3